MQSDELLKFGLGALFVSAALFWFLQSPAENPATTKTEKSNIMERIYPGPWNNDIHPGLITTLARNKVRGCGDFQWRKSTVVPEEYLIYCTRDGTQWVAWWVRLDKGTVSGPERILSSIPPPTW